MVKRISNKKLPLLGRKSCNVIVAEKQQNRPNRITEVYLSPLASKIQSKNKVKDLTSKLGTRMETGRLRRDLLGLRVEQPPGLLFNGLI